MQRRHLYIAWALLGIAVIGMVFAWGRLHNTASLHAPTLAEQLKPVKLRGPAPDFSASTIGGAKLANSDLTGKPTVLDFFASWCGPCKAEAAGLARLAQSYGDRVRFVGVDIGDTSKPTARAFLRKYGWKFPVIWDPNQHLINPFTVDGQPTMILIDRRGNLALKVPGQHSMAEYRTAIDKLEAG